MADNKKAFVLYADLINTFEELSDDEAGKLMKHLLRYVNDKDPVIEDRLLKIVFEPIKLQLKRDLVKYEGKKQQWSEAGKESAKQRALKKANDSIENPTELTDVEYDLTDSTVIDTVTETDKVKVTGTENKEAIASVNAVAEYSKILKDKKNICGFIATFKPKIIEPYFDVWNIFATETGLTKATKINDFRKKKFRTRIRDGGFDFIEILAKAKKSEFIQSGKHWFTFDWIFKDDMNYLKVIEGRYDDAEKEIKNQQNGQSINEKLKAVSKTSAAA